MKTASAYKSLCQEEKQFLSDIAEEVAMLVAKPEKRNYFCENLKEFGEKWKAYKTAYDARRKGKWQPSMGMPDDPLATIWPRSDGRQLSAGAFRFPYCGGAIRGVLGAYALLAVIHDKVLPNCPPIATGIWPKELASKIWQDLVTGANNEDQLIGTPKWVIPTGKLEAFLRDVNADIESYFAPEQRTEQKPLASGGAGKGEKLSKVTPFPVQTVATLEDVEKVALALLHLYRPVLELQQEARRVLDACAECPETSAGRALKEQLILDAWERVSREGWQVDGAERLPLADVESFLRQGTEGLHKNLNQTNLNLIRTARRLLPDVWERLKILPVGPPTQDLDVAERDWKRLVKAAGAERARQERDENAGAGKGEAEDLQPTLGDKSLQDVSATQEAKEYDAFLCHASEDKDAIVEPFAEAMEQQGLKPWFDKAEVRWGDSLVKKINYGLSRSKLVVVFVSPDFLGKKAWSEKEFNAAVSMEVNGKTVVLPLLCGVARDQIQQRYPVISDKVYREVPEYTASSKTEPSRLESLVRELGQRITERG